MQNDNQVFQRGYLNTYIIGSVPSFETLDLTCTDSTKEMFIFIDFNNIIKGLYYPKMLELIIQEIESNKGIFPSILVNEWVVLQRYLESYAESRHLEKLHVIYFSEGGQSYYHKNLFKQYKGNRKNAIFSISPTVSNRYASTEDLHELIRSFIIASWKWIEYYCKQANILAIRLENLDADFIPELLIRQYNIYNDDAAYVIVSSDGDYLQTLDIADNIFICDANTLITDKNWLNSKSYLYPSLSKKEHVDDDDSNTKSSSTSMVEQMQAVSEYKNKPTILNEDNIPDISPDKVILYKAIVGDSSDCIPGIKGVGVKGFFNKFIALIPNEVRADDVDAILAICEQYKESNKVCHKILSNQSVFRDMVKLVSFKMLISWLLLNKQRFVSIDKIINENYSALTESCNLKQLLIGEAITNGVQ